MMTHVAVVGDVHGEVSKLRALLRLLAKDGRPIVFVGDYVNGGAASAEVLEELSCLAVRQPLRHTFLAGNHDLALLQYITDGKFAEFAAMGGTATLHSYLGEVHGDVHAAFVKAFPIDHRAFLEGLRPCWDDGHVLISHVGFDPKNPSLRTMEALAIGGLRAPFSAGAFPRDLVVCGHYVQSSGRPYIDTHLICIDTGCGVTDGPLTALLLPEREFISV